MNWTPVVGFEDEYAVSEAGEVKSLARPAWNGNGRRSLRERILKPGVCESGRLLVVLYKNGKKYSRLVHKLVLEAFRGMCPPGMECCHNDGNASNNALDNLRWGTHAENEADKVLHGTTNRGERNGLAKLQASDVHRIRLLAEVGVLKKRIAEMFGISGHQVGDIVHRVCWNHIA